MHVARWILTAIVVLLIVALAWVFREKRRLAAAVAAWASPLAPECAGDLTAHVCAPLAAPLGPPPTWVSGAVTLPAAPAADLAAALMYAVSLTAQTTTSTLGFVAPPAVGGVANPVKVAAGAVDAAPFALVWANANGDSPWVAVGFRGTATAADLLADSHYGLASPTAAFGVRLADVVGGGQPLPVLITPQLPGGVEPTVHSGFASTYADLRGALMRAVAAAPPTAPVFIAGHSLGAALAFLAAADVATVYPGRAVRVVGVAPPRVGNSAFTIWLATRPGLAAVSLINLADLVPSLPWSYMPVLGGAPVAFAHVEPVVVGSAIWPDAVGCHSVPAYAASLAGALVLSPAVLQAPEWLPGSRSGTI